MKIAISWRAALAAAIVASMLLVPVAASAHERREVGNLQLVVGFLNEPAYEGEPNGATIRISKPAQAADGSATTTPVTGVAANLSVEVTHQSSGSKKVFAMREQFGTPGLYVANFIPTAPGTYMFHFTGDLEGQRLNEEFTSGPGRFNDIEAAREVQFPHAVGSGRELDGAVRGVQTAAQTASDDAASARTLALVGIIVGAVGVVAGLAGVGLAASRKKA